MPNKLKKPLPPLPLGPESIGDRIVRFRKQRGYTQKELATKIGIRRTLASDYETGRVRLYDEMVARFALALGVSTDAILGLKNSSEKDKYAPSLKIARRVKKIESLPLHKQKSILKVIDALVRDAEK